MPDSGLWESQTVLRLSIVPTLIGLSLLPPACFATDVAVTMFGPKQYLASTRRFGRLRTEDTVSYSDSFYGVRGVRGEGTFSGVQGKGTITIQNGDGGGNDLVTDAVVLFNGISIFDSSEMNQPGSRLEVPISMNDNNWISVWLIGAPGSYLTIQAAAEITPDATTTQVVGIGGGTVNVQNHLGDTFTLTIPPLALDQDTSISVSALPNALPGPIADSAWPGAVLEPEGLLFSVPVTMSVTLNNTPQNPNPAMLFWREDSSHVLPIGGQTTTQNSVTGHNFHFSTETAAFPTPGELSLNITDLVNGTTGMPTSPADQITALLSIATFAQSAESLNPAYQAVYQSAWNSAVSVATEAANAEIDAALPADPCSQAVTAQNANFAATLQGLGLETLASEILERNCSLQLSPPSLSLQVGQTSDQPITATLYDPKGNAVSCSPTGWNSSNQSVVQVPPSGTNCLPMGLAPGKSEVLANCGGISGSNTTTVTVCSLSGTWEGQYSGDTLGCIQWAANGDCVSIGTKTFSGTVAVPFTQTGTTVTAVIDGITLTGTDVNGTVSLGPIMVPCDDATSTCPAGIIGALAPDCSSFSGYFYDNRARTATGTFTFYPPAAQ